MPEKRITFIVIPANNNGLVCEYRLAPMWLWAIGLLILIAFGSLGYYANGYYRRVDQYANLDCLQAENLNLMRGLELARKEVGQLEETMGRLAADDERLRAYHLMDPLSAAERLGGIGGSEDLPEDYTALSAIKRNLLADLRLRIFRLKQETRIQADSFEEIRQKYLEREGNLRHFPTISPVPRDKTWVSSGFGHRVDPFTGNRAFHSGIDFAGPRGTPVYATADGVIAYAYKDLRLGNVVVIEHDIQEEDDRGELYTRPGLYRTEYGHLDKYLVKSGERVERGQQIGTIGNTGRSTGPHLHYAVRYQDRRRGQHRGYENPRLFILDEMSRDVDKVVNWWQED